MKQRTRHVVEGGRSRRDVVATLGATGVAGLAGCLGSAGGARTGSGARGVGGTGGTGGAGGNGAGGSDDDSAGDPIRGDSMTIFHAGSLAPPFAETESRFEDEFGVDVTREAQGSVASTQKLTQQRRSADVLGSSDFRLVRNRILPEYGDWYAVFATNAMAIQYREDAPGADEISTDNWWDVLSREDVTVGHSDPAVDPGGYRAAMTLQLGREPFRGERLYDDATYEALRANATVSTGTEINLVAQLESGDLDYVVYYRSIAESTGLPSIDLQQSVDLSRATDEYAQHYARAAVETASGTFVGAPIAYGITVPSVAEAPECGARWVEHFGTEAGRSVLEKCGFAPVDPLVVPASAAAAVPDRVMAVAGARETLGPLEL